MITHAASRKHYTVLLDRPERRALFREGFRSELFTEAIAAVDRTVCTGLERNFAGTAAGSAYSVKHLALAALAVVGSTFAGITAGFAALRLIGEALFSKKLLLVGGEGEFLSAIFADDRFVLEHVVPL